MNVKKPFLKFNALWCKKLLVQPVPPQSILGSDVTRVSFLMHGKCKIPMVIQQISHIIRFVDSDKRDWVTRPTALILPHQTYTRFLLCDPHYRDAICKIIVLRGRQHPYVLPQGRVFTRVVLFKLVSKYDKFFYNSGLKKCTSCIIHNAVF